ncbi:MAG TPA: hypothetical protein VH560_10985 [Polyangia bacterium]|nr:hypothetical protein [Polyangia bacterium]
MRRAGAASVVVLLALACGACERLASNLGGGWGPEAGVLRGKRPLEAHDVTHATLLTDGIAAVPGDPWRTDLTAVLTAPGASVTWDLGGATPVRCALVDADGDDSYALAISSDGQTFAPLWTATPDEDAGQQLRAGRDLRGAGRYLRLTATGGDGRWSVSEVSAWSECPKTWPPLAMQKGTPDDESLRLKLWAFGALALGYVLAYRKRAPDWLKLIGVVPAGLAVAATVQLVQDWPPSSSLALQITGVAAAIIAAAALKVARARPAPDPS